jgi:hypothetical protein
LVEHLLWEQDVAGSNPVAPTILFLRSRGEIYVRCANFNTPAASAISLNFFFTIIPSNTGHFLNQSALGIGIA